MFLLDTNVPSEMRLRKPDHRVRTWVESQPRSSQYLSVISLTELNNGAASHNDPVQRDTFQRWIDGPIRDWFRNRVLDVTTPIAETAGVLIGRRKLLGRPLAISDALIAATAIERKLILVTRNVQDFEHMWADVYNPWTDTLHPGTDKA